MKIPYLLLMNSKKTYSSETAIWWYTRDSFIYRILNKALRTQNIQILISFRFLIK